jgi:Proteasome subunit
MMVSKRVTALLWLSYALGLPSNLNIGAPNYVDKIGLFESAFVTNDHITRSFVPSDELQYHGTTTLAFKFGDGVIIAVDSKASVGSYVGSHTVKKIFTLSKHMVATMAGGAADCSYWIRRTAREADALGCEYGITLRTSAVARMLAASLREYRQLDLSVGTMVAGYDVEVKEPACKCERIHVLATACYVYICTAYPYTSLFILTLQYSM